MNCLIEEQMVSHEFLIAPNAVENIIGMDMLRPLHSHIKMAEKKLITSQGTIPLLDEMEMLR